MPVRHLRQEEEFNAAFASENWFAHGRQLYLLHEGANAQVFGPLWDTIPKKRSPRAGHHPGARG
jgi:hypothetical protein